MSLTKAVWDKYSVGNVLKFCVDLKQKRLFFHNFNIDHFIFALSIIGKNRPHTRDEFFSILDMLQNRIVGGNLIMDRKRFICLLGISGIEYELKPAHKDHTAKVIESAADLCANKFSKNSYFRPLIINKAINGKTIEHIRFS